MVASLLSRLGFWVLVMSEQFNGPENLWMAVDYISDFENYC